jgi:hypothetical protein
MIPRTKILSIVNFPYSLQRVDSKIKGKESIGGCCGAWLLNFDFNINIIVFR